jgi:hypothetical protein
MIAALVVAASIIDGYAGLIAPHQESKTMTERRDMPEPALHIAAAILQRDFSETFGVETIERFLTSCYDQLAARATVMTYLPLLAERFARQRLNAVARLEGWIRDCKPTVLFCAPTTPAAPRWRADSLPTWPGNGRWPGQVDPNPATK